MRDINEPLRIAYAAALTQISGVPVYYQYLPNNISPDNYIVFRSINSIDAGTKGSADTNTNITIEIHTKGNIGNQGLITDTIADQVYQLIYPNKQSNLSLSRGQVVQTELANDVVLDLVQRGQQGYISRFITFRHWIFVEGTGIGGAGSVVFTQGQVFRLEYTGIGGEASFDNSVLQNKRILDVSKDGIGCSGIITSGAPVDKEALYISQTGTIAFAMELAPNEKVFVLYQLN